MIIKFLSIPIGVSYVHIYDLALFHFSLKWAIYLIYISVDELFVDFKFGIIKKIL